MEMVRVWVIRLGEQGEFAEKCWEKGVVAIGWNWVGDISKFDDSNEIRRRLYETRMIAPESNTRYYKSEGGAGGAAGMLWTFIREMNKDDIVLSSKKDTRELLVGLIAGPYSFNPNTIDSYYPNIRPLKWLKKIPFDKVPTEIWRSMTAWQTIFELSAPDAIQAASEIISSKETVLTTKTEGTMPTIDWTLEGDRLYKEAKEKSMTILAQHFDNLDGTEFQIIVAGVLKAAGLFTKPIRKGTDQCIDIEAYRDPLMIGPPRILVQVKHRKGAVTGPEMREFLGAMNRKDDVGLYVSTGDYTKDAKNACEKTERLIKRMGWEDFVQLFFEVYDGLENEIKAKVPIDTVKILRNPETDEPE